MILVDWQAAHLYPSGVRNNIHDDIGNMYNDLGSLKRSKYDGDFALRWSRSGSVVVNCRFCFDRRDGDITVLSQLTNERRSMAQWQEPSMSNAAAIILVVSLVVTGSAILFYLEHRAKNRGKEAARSFRHRMNNPEFEALEKYFAHSLPPSLRELYVDSDLINSENISIKVPNLLEKEPECFIAFFEPATSEACESHWPGCEGLFAFANNGLGDQYLVDPRQPDPEVVYYLHETGKKKSLGVTLSQFLSAPRGVVEE